MARNLAESIEF